MRDEMGPVREVESPATPQQACKRPTSREGISVSPRFVTGNDRPFQRPGTKTWSIRYRFRDSEAEPWRRATKHSFPTRKAALAWRDRLRDTNDPSKITVSALFEIYLRSYTGQESTKTELRYRLGKFEEIFGDRRVAAVTPAEIQAWSRSLEKTRFEATQAVKQALRWGLEMGLTRANAAANVKNPTPVRPEIKPLSWSEIQRIAKKAEPYGPLIRFLASTGLRIQEAAALSPSDIDRSGSVPVVHVTKRLTKDRQIKAIPKNRKPRRVQLQPRALEALADQPRRLDSRFLFPSAKGGPLDIHNWRARVWTPALLAASIRRRGPNALRHSFATEALRNGMPTFTLGRVMGTSVQMIELHYGHLLAADDENVLGFLDPKWTQAAGSS
jgi:integrase